jgi:hypothetical protein
VFYKKKDIITQLVFNKIIISMAHVNFGFKLSYNREYYVQQSIERLRTMRTTFDHNYKQICTKTTVYDHTSKIEFDLESEIVFKPTFREDCLPNWDLGGQYMHLSRIQLGTKIESTMLSLTMRFALVKWPEEVPGLLFGIIPVDIFENKHEIYRNPYTGQIPNEDPKWGSYQYINTVWSKTSLYCLLIAEGSLENMKLCLNVICSRYFKKNSQTGVAFGQTMFDEASPYYIFKKIRQQENKKRKKEDYVESTEKKRYKQ